MSDILGISAFYHDSAACLVRDGEIVAAAQEERFNRIKHCAGFPEQSIRYCLAAAGIGLEDLDHVGISRDPSAHLHKKLLFAASRAAKQGAGAGLINQIKDRLGNAAAADSCARQLRSSFPNSTEAIRLRELERNAAQ